MFAASHPFKAGDVHARPQCLPITVALDRETAMLDEVAGGAAARALIWQCQTCLVVPRWLAACASFASAARELERHGYPVYVRNTGGDAVLQGPGVVNVSLAFAVPAQLPDRIGKAYEALCAPLMSLLGEHGIATGNGTVAGAMCDGAFNVTACGRKLAGTAQRWRRERSATRSTHFAVLGHLALSVDIDHATAANAVNAFYAAMGAGNRVDGSVHINLTELLPANRPLTADAITRLLTSRYASAVKQSVFGKEALHLPSRSMTVLR